MTQRARLAAATLAVLLAGCSAPATTVQTPATPTASPITSAPTPTPTPTPTKPAVLNVGDTFTTANGTTIQLLETKTITRPDDTTPLAVLVKTCVADGGSQPVGLSWEPWTAVGPDGEQYPVANDRYGDDPKPEYPWDDDTQDRRGTCVKGWLVFTNNAGEEITRIAYASQSGRVSWTLG
ncbi:MAG: hypothetical protein L0G22_03555 [Propionibacteriaceae bacterium]|nr:hypothetical protein [Propionibacteriaceae bacterium]